MGALSEVSDEGELLIRVWAPLHEEISLHIIKPINEVIPMEAAEDGYFQLRLRREKIDQYFFKTADGKDLPDPASMYQPDGVHGASAIVDHQFNWTDQDYKGLALADMILYEIHVGTFTPEGSFDAIIPRLDELKETGINTLALMPICQFPGNRNWGYDGVFLYAVHNTYGGPEGLKRLVDACHARNMAVILDVVYNHLGPEGNYLPAFGPYFTERYCTPWGNAINYDDAWSDGVREFFSENPAYWFRHYHIDGLRCDAVHTIFDIGAVSIWELMQRSIRKEEARQGRPFIMIAESDLNSPRVIKDPEVGGMGFTAQWLDDFHHALYVVLDSGGKDRYYDFGHMKQLAKAYKDGFVHTGEWVKFRKKHYGASSAGIPGDRFIVFNVNHDQVGNRVGGERLGMLVDERRTRLAAAAMMLSPYVPMLFMGEEYGDDTPFFYFVSHSDPELIKMVQEGRMRDFKDFGFDSPPPDPEAEETFTRSIIHWEKRNEAPYSEMLKWHKHLLKLRAESAVLRNYNKEDIEAVNVDEKALIVLRRDSAREQGLVAFFNFRNEAVIVSVPQWLLEGRLILCMDEDLPGKIIPGTEIQLPPASVLLYAGGLMA